MNEALDDSLQDLGYLHTLPLRNGESLLADPLCHYFDIAVGNNEAQLDSLGCSAWNEFFEDLIKPTTRTTPTIAPSSNIKQHGFIMNEEKRAYLIHDFITTETNYVKNLETFISLIVHPIRSRSKGTRKSNVVLGAYECHQVFMNIEEIHQANTGFSNDLHKYTKHHSNRSFIGLLFSRHLDNFKCYRNFLLGVENARHFHTKELKHNVSYQAFIDRVTDDGNSTVYGYLLLPAERIGYYRVFLQELIKHTAVTDPDFTHLSESLAKIEDIASLHDDYHTNLIYVFQSMLQSIQNCPASLISQQRSLICHIDATEHEMQTLKPLNPVTIFLFTDKVMVVRRPSYESDGLELCGLDQKLDKAGDLSFFVQKTELQHSNNNRRLDRKLKFRGWIGLNDVEIYQGVPELPSSFTLMTTNTGGGSSSPETDQVLENYFQQDGVRLFCLSPPFLLDTNTSSSSPALSSSPSSLSSSAVNRSSSSSQQLASYRNLAPFTSKQGNFIKQFGKTKVKLRTSDIPTTYYFWNGHHFYANIHDMSYYHATPSKNDTVLIYTSKPLTNIRSILGESYEAPQTLIVVAPSSNHQYSFFIKSRHSVATIDDHGDDVFMELPIDKHDEFKYCLLTNVIRSDKEIQAIVRHKLSPSPSPQSSTKSVRDTFRQMNRRKSISTINKLLTGSVQATGNFVKMSTAATITRPQQQQQQKQRPKSASYHHEPLNDSIDQHHYQRTSNEIVSQNIPSVTNKPSTLSANTLTPTSSFLNYRASVVQQRRQQQQQQQQQLISASSQTHILPKTSSLTSQPGLISQRNSASSSYKPSIHPTQTMSYDIKTVSKESSSRGQKEDTIEDRVNLLCVALAQEMDLATNNYQGNQRNSSASSSHHGSIRELYTTDMGATATNLGRSTSSVLANNEVSQKLRPTQEPILETLNGRFMTTMHSKKHHQTLNPSHSTQQRTLPSRTSPISFASPSSGPAPSTTTTLDTLIAEMVQMKSDFDKRLSQVVQDYEQTGAIVQKLMCDLQRKEDEIDSLRMKYEKSVKENGLLYEAFNNEIDHIFNMTTTTYQDSQQSNNTMTGDHHDNIELAQTQDQRSAHHTLEAQWRKKVEMTIKERNQWHQTACELARELQDVTAYFETIQVIDDNDGPEEDNNDGRQSFVTTTAHHVTTSVSSPMPNRPSGRMDHHGGGRY